MTSARLWIFYLLVLTLTVNAPVFAQEEPLSLDEEFASLASKIPGFGGMYLDERGTTHVFLVDLSWSREAQALGERVEVHQGDYDFRDLFAWKDEVRSELSQPGAVFLDIDERRNRLLFGVEDDALGTFTADLRAFLRGTRVPPEAVLVEATEPIEPQEQLTDKIRPVPMGVQIQRTAGNICTLGVNANRLGVRGFVTASHCTQTRSDVEGTVFFQSSVGSTNQVGVETVDPPFFLFGGCPPGRFCRRSDAAFVAYDSSSLTAGGEIANPLSCVMNDGTLTTDPAQPRLPLAGATFGNPMLGFPVLKVGRTTGCTWGFLGGTCVDANVSGSFITMLCQNRVDGAVGISRGGDSGSPVFRKNGDDATLYGVLWGGLTTLDAFFYSPWSYVHSELGGSITPAAP